MSNEKKYQRERGIERETERTFKFEKGGGNGFLVHISSTPLYATETECVRVCDSVCQFQNARQSNRMFK